MSVFFGGGYPRWALGPLALPSNVVVALSALAIAVAGLVWMVRIIRGPRDEPPSPWRYRDRPSGWPRSLEKAVDDFGTAMFTR
jgi:hypothetical protein